MIMEGAPTTGPDAVAPILRRWELPAPTHVRMASGGTNNIVRIIESGGLSYVLRIYQNLTPERIAAEHRLLAALADAGLPFAVPQPIATPDGQTYVSMPDGVAALLSYLPGRTADHDDLSEIERAGEALALLDLALADLPTELAPVDWRQSPLDALHPAVTSLDDLADDLAVALPDNPGVAWLRAHAGPTNAAYAALCRTLPVRLIHGDFALSNLLVDDEGNPAAFLDFEVAGLDLGVNDLVVGIAQGAGGWWDADRGSRANTFYRGFTRHLSPTPAELAAFPDLLRRRVLGTIIWRAGRWRCGQAHLDEVQLRLDTAAHIGRWLDQHAATLPDQLAAL